jgi:hypothetical protein
MSDHALTQADQPILMPGGHRVRQLPQFDRELLHVVIDSTLRHGIPL